MSKLMMFVLALVTLIGLTSTANANMVLQWAATTAIGQISHMKYNAIIVFVDFCGCLRR